MSVRRTPALITLALAALALAGCRRSPPPVVEVDAVVLLNDQPLPNALVEFVPDLKHFGAEMNSTGVTDEKGRVRLVCASGQQPGAVAGKHHVLVTEAP